MIPNVSVLVTVYNRPEQIVQCLDSIVAGTYRDYEIIVVDDGSTDATAERLATWVALPRPVPVKMIRNAKNLGHSGARNAGIDAMQGRIICTIDSDCVAEPAWLSELIQTLEESGAAAAVGKVQDHPPRNYTELAYTGNPLLSANTVTRRLVTTNLAIRREHLLRYNFDPAFRFGLCEDDDLGWRLLAEGHRIAFAQLAVTHHNHPMNFRGYLRTGLRQGKASAMLWYKHGIFVGRDLIFPLLVLALLPFLIIDLHILWIILGLLLLQSAALVYNQYALKGKSLIDGFRVLPLETVYYCAKIYGYCTMMLAIAFGREPAIVASKRAWLEKRQSPS